MNKIIETEELKIELKETQQALYEALNKIDKAIEYIHNAIYKRDEIFGIELLEILGENNE